MKCACREPACGAEVGFDSENGLLLVDLNDPTHGLRGVGSIYLSVETAAVLASQLKAFLLRVADTPAETRTIVLLKDGAHGDVGGVGS